MLNTKSMAEKLHAYLESLTPEELKEIKEEYFPEKNTPKGWISIEDELPMMSGADIMQGYTEYKIKRDDGSEGRTRVSDHNTWYYDAKQFGITHWWNE